MRRRSGFSLLEIIAVLVIVSILAAMGVGAYSRYRASTTLNQAANRLTNQILHFLTEARANAAIQRRAGVELAGTTLTATNTSLFGVPEARVMAGTDEGPKRIQQFALNEGAPTPMNVTSTNLPNLPLQTNDTGMVLELGVTPNGTGTFQRLCTVLFNPDGTILLASDTEPGRIELFNGVQKRRIEISRVGKVTQTRI